jgi:hypothetical protein
MSTTRLAAGLTIIALAGAAFAAPQPEDAATSAQPVLSRGARLAHDLQSDVFATIDHKTVFDNMTDADSSQGLNIAYVNLGSYDGSDTSSSAYLVPMSTTGTVLLAPDPGTGPTDIWFDEYAVDLDAWGNVAGTMQTLTKIDYIPAIQNTDGVPRQSVLRISFFNFDGDQFLGGVVLTYDDIPDDYAGWFDTDVDLTENDLTFDVYDVGYALFDWVNDPDVGTDEGLGIVNAGGDLLDDTFPAPEDQWTLGETDPTSWLASDGETNVDPDFDGEPDVSYIDVLNTSDLINWGFQDDTTNPTSEQAHDFPFRLYIEDGGSTTCPEDLDGDDDIDLSDLGILLAAFNIDGGGDIDGDGDTDLSDLGALLAKFGGGC